MKLLIIYNPKSGKGKILKHINYIKEKLSQKYEIYSYAVKDGERIRDYIKNDKEKYDVFLAIGGDGTVNAMISGICDLDYYPKIAIIPFGTINDMAKNLGMKKNINKSLDIILNSNSYVEHKIYKANDNYFDYAFALGVCTGVSFIKKKRLGFISYYLEAIKLFFVDKKNPIKLYIDDKLVYDKFYLLFATNSSHVAGYKIKQGQKITITVFKGLRIPMILKLLWYMITGRTKHKYEVDSFKIETKPGVYNGDGEEFKHDGLIDVSYYKTFDFICSKKIMKNIDK